MPSPWAFSPFSLIVAKGGATFSPSTDKDGVKVIVAFFFIYLGGMVPLMVYATSPPLFSKSGLSKVTVTSGYFLTIFPSPQLPINKTVAIAMLNATNFLIGYYWFLIYYFKYRRKNTIFSVRVESRIRIKELIV